MKEKAYKSSLVTTIAQNRRAKHEYFIEQEIEAGLSLQGWEVKSLRSGKANISNSYIIIKDNEAYLISAIFQPLNIVTTSHIVCNPMRNRKLLFNKCQINSLLKSINREGYTLVALSLYWKKSWIKLKIGVAKGKKIFDKRITIKKLEWQLNKSRIIKYTNR